MNIIVDKKIAFNLHHLPWLIFTLLVFSALIKLGFWQSERAEQKQQRLTRITQLNQQAPISLPQLLLMEEKQALDINDVPVLLEGEFDSLALFFLDNQVDNGRLGYRVYQVFRQKQYAVLVNLGWVAGAVNRAQLPQVPTISGAGRLSGHVRQLEPGIVLMEQQFSSTRLTADQWPLRVQQIEPDKFSPLIDGQLLPFVVYLDKNEQLGYKKNWQPIVMPPEKHQAYAFQWFSLALAWLLLMFWAAVTHHKKNKEQGH